MAVTLKPPPALAPVAICVPVRDEEQALPALLDALAALDRRDVAAEACFYLDSCSDGSEAVLRRAARCFPFAIRIERGGGDARPNAGAARRAATAMGIAHCGGAADAMLLSTDADSQPRPDWIAAARVALAVADFAAGRMERIDGADDPVQTRLEAYYDRLHAYRRAVDPVPWDDACGHHFGGGANLAFRPACYAAIGGFRAIASGEDALLLDDAARAGFRVRRDSAMVVGTSSRRTGRAAGGLAAALRAIDIGGAPMVAHPAGAAWQYRTHAEARRAFDRRADARAREWFGGRVGVSGDHVLGVGRDCPNGEAFAMRIVPAPAARPLVSLAAAEDALRHLERTAFARVA